MRWTRCCSNKRFTLKAGDLVSDLEISSDLRGNIYALEVHTNTFFTNNSGLTALEKDTPLLFYSQGFTDM